jgi:hypothetical protein
VQVKTPDKAAERRRRKAAAARKWRKDNPELAKQAARDRYRQDPSAAAAKVQKWRKDHPEQWSKIQRASNLRLKYGLTLEKYAELLQAQGGCCAICRSTDPKSKNGADRPGEFAVDHDHATGEVRGLLCGHCNTGLGLFQDDASRLQAAMTYLASPRP